jgi:hypothetical protein
MKKITKSSVIAMALASVLSAGSVLAHEADCGWCSLPVVQDTAERDNETVLKMGRKHFEYRCVYCAMADAQASLNGDLKILAPSDTKGKPVEITRVKGEWKTAPDAVFVAVKASHKVCQDTYRAFSTRAAFDEYAKKNKETPGDAKPVTLAEMVKLSAPKSTEKK